MHGFKSDGDLYFSRLHTQTLLHLFIYSFQLQKYLVSLRFFPYFLLQMHGSDNVFDGKEEMKRLDIFATGEEESMTIHSEAQSNTQM